jgi:hypothetical protein
VTEHTVAAIMTIGTIASIVVAVLLIHLALA